MVKLRRIYESKLFLESEKDKEDLKAYFIKEDPNQGEDLFNSYMKIRNKIPKEDLLYRDFSRLKKLSIDSIRDYVEDFKSEEEKKKEAKKGAKKLYEDSEWVVYFITNYPAASIYGKGTKWCISGNYMGDSDRGEYYFNKYIDAGSAYKGYYFFLNRNDPNEKYCILQTKDNKIHSIWDAKDQVVAAGQDDGTLYYFHPIPELPKVKQVNYPPVKANK